MKFFLVFDRTGDTLPFKVIYNQPLMEFFVDQLVRKQQNSFTNDRELFKDLEPKITHLHWAISKTNEVLYDLIGQSFAQHTDLDNYLDQKFLNRTHADWVFSHRRQINIDSLRFSNNQCKAKLGNFLHNLYPDNIRLVPLAPIMEKLGYIYPFQEVNNGIHCLETSFTNLEFKADEKWCVFDNPYIDQMITNNDIVNFSFGYTYVGRQYYNKFKLFDTELECTDHYNYEQLEFAFQVNLSQPETIPFSKESLAWANRHNIKLVAEQIPIANLIDLESKLFDYRKILYRNSRDNNRASIVLN